MRRAVLPAAALTLAIAACSQTPPPEPAVAPGPRASTSASANAPPASPSVAVTKDEHGQPMMRVDPADQRCSSNADCAIVVTQCSCDCGSAINNKSAQKYGDAFKPMCESYQGPQCKMSCKGTVSCESGVCRIKP